MTRKSSSLAFSFALTLANSFSTLRSLGGASRPDAAAASSCCFFFMYSSYDMVLSSFGGSPASAPSVASSLSAVALTPPFSTSASSTEPSFFRASSLSEPQFLAPPPPFLISFPRPVPDRRSYWRFPSLAGARPPLPCFVFLS